MVFETFWLDVFRACCRSCGKGANRIFVVVQACKYKFGSLQFRRNICLAYNQGLGSCWIFSFLYGFNVIAVPKKCVTAQKKLFCDAYQGLDEHIYVLKDDKRDEIVGACYKRDLLIYC